MLSKIYLLPTKYDIQLIFQIGKRELKRFEEYFFKKNLFVSFLKLKSYNKKSQQLMKESVRV